MNCDVEKMPNEHAALVAAEELDDEARDRVEQHVQPERPARETRAAPLGRQQDEQDQRSAPASYSCVGCSGTFSGVPTFAAARVGERDRPRHLVGLP